MKVIIKPSLFLIGVMCVLLGIIGLFIPLLPTTPFILLAAWCFYRSSTRAHDWLLRQPILGTAIKDWEKRKAIRRKNKFFAIVTIYLSILILWIKDSPLFLKASITIVLASVSIFIISRNEQ